MFRTKKNKIKKSKKQTKRIRKEGNKIKIMMNYLKNTNSKHALLELHFSEHLHKSLLLGGKGFKRVLGSINGSRDLFENEGDNEVVLVLNEKGEHLLK